MIGKVLKALTEKDCVTLAACFTENCTYIDYCPSLNGMPSSFIYGSACMEMYFRMKFMAGELEVAEPLLESDSRATFFEAYNNGPYVYAGLDIEEDDGGRIKKAVVHPA
jgi:hypothetical protein